MPPSPQDLLKKVQGGASAPLLSDSPIPSPNELLTKVRADNPAPSFGSTLLSTAGSFLKKAASAVTGFVGKQAETVAAGARGEYWLTPADALEGVKQTLGGLGTGAGFIAQGINEGAIRIGRSVQKPLTEFAPDIFVSSTKNDPFTQSITGSEETLPIQYYMDKARGYAIDNNASIPEANTFAGIVGIGMLFADNPVVGPGGAKGVLKLSEKAIKELAQSTEDDLVKAILKRENPLLNETQLDALAPVFRSATNDAEVKAAAEQIAKIQRSPLKPSKTEDLPNPDEVFTRSKQNFELPKAVLEEPSLPFFRATNEGEYTRFLPVDGQSVKLIDGLETFLHKPENGAYEVMEASTGRIIGSPGATAQEAIDSAKAALAGRTLEDVQMSIQKFELAPREAPTAPRTFTGAPKPFPPNLVRAIANEELPGPIIDTLKVEFPALSENAIAPIAKRLAKLHRTGDIEGILQVVRNISDDITRARAGGRARGATPGPIVVTKETLDQSIAKVGERKAVGDLPASVGELLTSAERGKYLDNVSRVIKDADSAVLAQQEYDALWEHADQRVIDRYEELKTERDIVRAILDDHPGRELNNLYKGTFKSPQDVPLDELINQKKKGTDTRIDEILGQTGADIEVAQKELDAFYQMRAQLLEIEKDIREIRPKARAARILQEMIEDVPIISRKNAGEIEALARSEDVRAYKDISGFMGQARDVYRNFEAVFGDKFKDVKRVILDPFDRSKGDMVDLLREIGDDLETNIIKKYGFQRGSKESAAIQRYGDTTLLGGERRSAAELATEFGQKKAEQIIEADAYFRNRYNAFIDRVNEVRAKIFPNDPSKLIPKRKDYYRHFTEMGDGFKALIDLFETPAGINPQLAGLSEWTKPKSKFLSFAQERLGTATTIDAVGGFLDYAPSYAYAVHIDQHIGNFRYLRRRLSENAPTPGVRELVPVANEQAAAMGATDLVKQDGINNFLEYLDHFANDLAGKTNPMDRYLQTMVPGGRKTFRVVNWINSRVKANAILGNLSSAIAQAFNIPNGVASAKLYSLPGIRRTLSSVLTKNEPMELSSFIKERYRGDLASRFKIDWVDHPIIGTSERAKDVAVWITQVMDEVGTKFIWNAHYEKGLAEGLADPVKYADDVTRRMVAGRGVGEVPLIQKSKIFQLVAPFQVEVGNAWYVLSNFIRRKDFGAVATLLVANYLMNRAAEEVRGSPVVFDPIEALIDGATQASDELQDGNAGRAAFKFTGRQVGELLSNIPLGQTVAAAVPDSWVQGATQAITGAPIEKKEIFGSRDPGRFGSGLLAINGLSDPLYRLFPPFGGMQVKRTIEGIQSMVQGQVKDSKGQVSFTTTPTFLNVVQATLFGKNATQEAQAFYETRQDLFQRVYRQEASRTELGFEAEKVWADVKALPRDQAIAKMQELETSNPALAEAIGTVADSEAQGLDGRDRLVGMLGVENGERAKYIVDSVNDLKTRDERVKFLQNLDDKGLISDQVFDQVAAMMKLVGVKSSVSEGKHDTGSILDTVLTYGEALGVDPVTAFNRMFTGQTIRRVDNGTIIVERMELSASQAERAVQAGVNGVNGMNLDHTIPLQLGGDNSKGNLKLVPEATWASYTPVENMLGEALRANRISKKEAQDLIRKFKSGEVTAAQVEAQIGQ